MALTLTPIAPSQGRMPRHEIGDIPADVAEAVEDAYAYCTANPGARLEAKVAGDKDGADAWLKMARDYAYQRPKGRIVIAGNSTKNGLVRFSATTVAPAETPAAS